MKRQDALLALNKQAETVDYIASHLNDQLNLDETGMYVRDLYKECVAYLVALNKEGFALPKKQLDFDPFEITSVGSYIQSSNTCAAMRHHMTVLLDLIKKERHIGNRASYSDLYVKALGLFLRVAEEQPA